MRFKLPRFLCRPVCFVLLACLLLLVEAAAAGDFSVQRSCPVCNINFSAIAPASQSAIFTIDGRPLDGRLLPLPECPLCGGVFGDVVFTDAELKRLAAIIWSAEYQKLRSSDVALRYAALMQLVERSDYEIAISWLRAAWSNEEKPELRRSCLEKSLEYFKNCLTSEELTDRSFEIYIKTADLLRQLGRFDDARILLKNMQKKNEFKQAWYPMVIKYCLELVNASKITPETLPAGNQLHAAIDSKNASLAASLARDKSLLNEINMAGLTPLMLAIKSGNRDITLILLNNGADPAQNDIYGNSPLHLAARLDDKKVAGLLFRQLKTPDQLNNAGQTPLYVAVEAGNCGMARSFIQAGADINRRDSQGNTLAHLLCGRNASECTSLFLSLAEKFVDINQRNFKDLTPIHLAAKCGNIAAVAAMVKVGGKIDARTPDGSSALFFCVPEIIPALIELGADVNLKNNSGCNAFVAARIEGQFERIIQFKKTGLYGKKPKLFKLSSGFGDIFSAASTGDNEVIKEILQTDKAQVNAQEISLGETPLHRAVAAGLADTVRLLLQNGAEVNAIGDFLRTPLHYAAVQGDLNVVKILCSASANVYALDARGSTPLHDAAAAGHRKIYAYLVEQGASDTTLNNQGVSPAALLED